MYQNPWSQDLEPGDLHDFPDDPGDLALEPDISINEEEYDDVKDESIWQGSK